MRKLVLLAAVAATTIVSGCVVVPARGGYRYYDAPPAGGPRYYRGDRDGDGVPNRYDARPGNPYRY